LVQFTDLDLYLQVVWEAPQATDPSREPKLSIFHSFDYTNSSLINEKKKRRRFFIVFLFLSCLALRSRQLCCVVSCSLIPSLQYTSSPDPNPHSIDQTFKPHQSPINTTNLNLKTTHDPSRSASHLHEPRFHYEFSSFNHCCCCPVKMFVFWTDCQRIL
jgi:hypothetical protein